MSASIVIPDKLYFRIGDVSELLDVKPYVLRYWETEFPEIQPQKSKSGQRLYKRRDVELLVQIKTLLYEQGFTIAGAKNRLKEIEKTLGKEVHPETKMESAQQEFSIVKKDPAQGHTALPADEALIKKVKQELKSCLDILTSL